MREPQERSELGRTCGIRGLQAPGKLKQEQALDAWERLRVAWTILLSSVDPLFPLADWPFSPFLVLPISPYADLPLSPFVRAIRPRATCNGCRHLGAWKGSRASIGRQELAPASLVLLRSILDLRRPPAKNVARRFVTEPLSSEREF